MYGHYYVHKHKRQHKFEQLIFTMICVSFYRVIQTNKFQPCTIVQRIRLIPSTFKKNEKLKAENL